MTKLYADDYLPKLLETETTIAVKKGVLLENHSKILKELKDITRLGVHFHLAHNMKSGRDTDALLKPFSSIRGIDMVQIDTNDDFYAQAIWMSSKKPDSPEQNKNKLIFLEYNHITNNTGWRVNLLFSRNILGKTSRECPEIVASTTLKSALILMGEAVESRTIDRIHILRADKQHSIRDELFSIKGSGTLIEQDFSPVIKNADEQDENVIYDILQYHKWKGQLRHRSREYIRENIGRFKVAEVDDIPVGCIEIIPINDHTIEFGAIAVNERFMDYRIGKKLVASVEEYARTHHKNIIAITANPKLEAMLMSRGYVRAEKEFKERSAKSPNKHLYLLASRMN